MDKKCILFDVDGVIVRTEMFGVRYQNENGLLLEDMLPFYKGIFQECLVGKADLKSVIKPWLKKWKWHGTANDFLTAWFDYENKIDQKMIDLIKKLQQKNVLCFAATNQEKYRTDYMRTIMGFEKIFDGIFSSAEIGHKKPDSDFYNFILQKLNHLDKKDILYIDDAPSFVEGAQKMDIPSYLYTEFDDLKKYLKS